ncbi:hypothetical protein Tco_0422222 [Tanacetum coccineum]
MSLGKVAGDSRYHKGRSSLAGRSRVSRVLNDIGDQSEAMVHDEGNESTDAYCSIDDEELDEPVNANVDRVVEDTESIDPEFNVKHGMIYLRLAGYPCDATADCMILGCEVIICLINDQIIFTRMVIPSGFQELEVRKGQE